MEQAAIDGLIRGEAEGNQMRGRIAVLREIREGVIPEIIDKLKQE